PRRQHHGERRPRVPAALRLLPRNPAFPGLPEPSRLPQYGAAPRPGVPHAHRVQIRRAVVTLGAMTTPWLPERIAELWSIATNLAWSWSRDARGAFRTLDPPLWHLTRHNPLELLRRVSPERLTACAADPEFLKLYDGAVQASAAARDPSAAGTWFAGA